MPQLTLSMQAAAERIPLPAKERSPRRTGNVAKGKYIFYQGAICYTYMQNFFFI